MKKVISIVLSLFIFVSIMQIPKVDGTTGSVQAICSVCGENLYYSDLEESYGAGYPCESSIYQFYRCTNCRNREQVVIPQKDHAVTAYADFPATCTKKGSTGGSYCLWCRKVLEEQTVIPALGHDYVRNENNKFVCKNCGEVKDNSNNQEDVLFPIPTCKKCWSCGSTYFSEPYDITKTWCMYDGEVSYMCYECYSTNWVIMPSFPCTFMVEKYIPPTYAEYGVAVYECTYCEYEYVQNFPAENSNDKYEFEEFTIHGYAGTDGEAYAQKYGLDFVVFDKGDADESTAVNINDVTCMQKIIAKITSTNDFKTANCDLNGDGKLNIRDATLLQLYLANKIDKFPVQE